MAFGILRDPPCAAVIDVKTVTIKSLQNFA
jgi:hypothetical protein